MFITITSSAEHKKYAEFDLLQNMHGSINPNELPDRKGKRRLLKVLRTG